MNDEIRVRTAAFNITSRFEGGGYHTYQNIDAGIISYGRFQFTLASGSLSRIVDKYLAQSGTQTAVALSRYQSRIAARDETLRGDQQLRELLVEAARDPIMRQIQDEEAVERYWETTKQIAIIPRNLQTPLTWALLFDISINFGVGDGFLRMAERELGVPQRSQIIENGLTEQQLIVRVAELRKLSHDRQAERDNLPGLKVRGEFWLNLVHQGDWHLQGDEDGNIMVKGRPLQVRSPQTGPSIPDDLDPAKFYITPVEDRIRIRDEPVTGDSLSFASSGDILEVMEPYQQARPKVGMEGEWIRIRTADGIEGYTAAWFYAVYQEPATTPDDRILYIKPTENLVRVRAAPIDGEPLGLIRREDIVEVLEPYDEALAKVGVEGEWLYIRTPDGIEGYTAAQFYTVYDGSIPEPEPEPAPDGTLFITPIDDRIRVRAAPVEGEPIAILMRGDIVEVLEPSREALTKIGVEGEWLHIRTLDGTEGYTAAWFYTVYNGPIPEPEPAPGDRIALITPVEDGIRVREEPVDGKPIATLSVGEIAEVLEPYDEALAKIGVEDAWLHVRTPDGIEGYTAAWLYTIYEKHLYITSTDDRVRIRTEPVEGETIGFVSRGDILQVLEPYDEAVNRVGVEDEWLYIRTLDGTEGHVAAWFFKVYEGRLPGEIPEANMTGVNLDLYHELGKPIPGRLGSLGWVRFLYNVSLNPEKPEGDPARYGNTDLNATYARYRPVLARYAEAGIKVILVFTHQTFGEGAGYNWHEMSEGKWRDLSDKFAAMVGRIAQQYKGQGYIYQIWNEMDAHTGARASVPLPPKLYGYMLTQSIRTIRAADPFAIIITGGHASGPGSGSLYARRTFQAMPNDVRPDGIAFHPYGRGAPVSNPKYRPFGTLDESIEAYRQILPGRPLWITEWGILNAPDEPPEDVAKYAREFMGHLKSKYATRVAAALWFAWGQGMDNGYGIVDRSDNPRGDLTGEFINL